MVEPEEVCFFVESPERKDEELGPFVWTGSTIFSLQYFCVRVDTVMFVVKAKNVTSY